MTAQKTADGRTVMYVCESAGDRMALKALRSTRASIAANASMSDEIRREVLRDIDEEIADLSR